MINIELHMPRRGLWSTQEKELLNQCISGEQNYAALSQDLDRSLWAVECQVIKAVREKGDDPLDFGISNDKIEKYDSVGKRSAAKAELEMDEKKLHIRALSALLDLNDIKTMLTDIISRLDRLERM